MNTSIYPSIENDISDTYTMEIITYDRKKINS